MPNTPQEKTPADIPLFRSARFTSYTFKEVKSGTDISTKISPGSPQEFYLLHWSELPGKKNECVKISEECAVRLLRSLAVMPDTLAGMEFVNILHHLPAYYTGKERSLDVVFVIEDDPCGKYIEYFRRGPEVETR